jgi:hypothetical protein
MLHKNNKGIILDSLSEIIVYVNVTYKNNEAIILIRLNDNNVYVNVTQE